MSRLLTKISKYGSIRSFHLSRSLLGGGDALFVHRDSADNNPEVPFEFSADSVKHLEAMTAKFPVAYRSAAILPALHIAQRQHGWLPISAMHKVAEYLGVPKMRIYEVATFYTMYMRQKIGKYHLQVCGTTPCMLRGAEDHVALIEKKLGLKVGGPPTPDGLFSLVEVECLGACCNAPMMQINDDYYEDLRLQDTEQILDQLKQGKQPQRGPWSGRRAAEPITGLTALKSDPPGPGFKCRPDL